MRAVASASVQTAEACPLGLPDGSEFEGVGDIVWLQPHARMLKIAATTTRRQTVLQRT